MFGRALIYWAAVWFVTALGLQAAYWIIYLFAALLGLLGFGDGAWDAPVATAFSRALFAVPALVATIITIAHVRDWWRQDQS